jgi:hypothetical protein
VEGFGQFWFWSASHWKTSPCATSASFLQYTYPIQPFCHPLPSSLIDISEATFHFFRDIFKLSNTVSQILCACLPVIAASFPLSDQTPSSYKHSHAHPLFYRMAICLHPHMILTRGPFLHGACIIVAAL